MNYEYNGNLDCNERIKLVSNEIINYYPFINKKKAKKTSLLEDAITSNITINDKLNRLYNIMLVNCDNMMIVSKIYNDFLNMINDNYNDVDKKYIIVIEKINNYFQGIDEFPII